MNQRKLYYLFILWVLCCIGISCDDLEDQPLPQGDDSPEEMATAELYVLNEGLFNLNNSTLFRYDFARKQRDVQYFKRINKRGLGDTATDAALYGSKIYIVVNVSSYVEVIDFLSGKSLKQIPFRQENGSSRQPRQMAFHKDKVYVCSFDGTVARIDTTSLAIEAITKAGRNPDGICIQNNQIFVSNSGGLDADAQGVDHTVSVIDIESFSEIKKIEVGPNPGKILPDTQGNVYVVTRGDQLEEGNYALHKINATTHMVTHTYADPVLNFVIHKDFAYAYSYHYRTQECAYPLIDLITDQTLSANFITGKEIQKPYAIAINPFSDNIYISDAANYQTEGDIYCFDQQGELLYKIANVGLNPNTLFFSDISSKSDGNIPEPEPISKAFASKVLEYHPAPGQFINTTTSAYQEGFTYEEVLAFANERIKKRSLFSLGGYGGYITLGFEESIPNKEGEYDFKVYGNAFYSPIQYEGELKAGSAEPGIVMVSKDENKNGIPDDAWYELAGSEYYSDETILNYEITYFKPNENKEDILWKDNQGNSGIIRSNPIHNQSYFPLWITEQEITFKGSKLQNNIKEKEGRWVNFSYPWGYADNHPNRSDLSNFKIEWAVNENGEPVHLDEIDFIRIYTAVNQSAESIGEVSTEIETVENLHYN
ncbi:MAG: YncE family protein [Bacteroidales bacterium]|nr:YncE family protein [Bacteroidales bacterium]